MKITKIFVAILALCAFAACEPNNGNNGGGGVDDIWGDNGSPIGEWVLTEWNNSKDLPFGIYLQLNEDNTFDLYQHTSNVLWVHYTGTYSLNGTTLSGVYSDGESWGYRRRRRRARYRQRNGDCRTSYSRSQRRKR